MLAKKKGEEEEEAEAEAEAEKKDSGLLKPLLQAGGLWEGGVKTPLLEEHYVPIQPLERAKRWPTDHCRETLFKYLEGQKRRENEALRMGTVYMDGVFDMFHAGHLEAIRKCVELGDKVVVGVCSDGDAEGYKRRPIINERDRVAIIGALRGVDKVICPCPLVVTDDFMESEGIDLVVHGFADDADFEKQREFFAAPIARGAFKRIEYSPRDSTTSILARAGQGSG